MNARVLLLPNFPIVDGEDKVVAVVVVSNSPIADGMLATVAGMVDSYSPSFRSKILVSVPHMPLFRNSPEQKMVADLDQIAKKSNRRSRYSPYYSPSREEAQHRASRPDHLTIPRSR